MKNFNIKAILGLIIALLVSNDAFAMHRWAALNRAQALQRIRSNVPENVISNASRYIATGASKNPNSWWTRFNSDMAARATFGLANLFMTYAILDSALAFGKMGNTLLEEDQKSVERDFRREQEALKREQERVLAKEERLKFLEELKSKRLADQQRTPKQVLATEQEADLAIKVDHNDVEESSKKMQEVHKKALAEKQTLEKPASKSWDEIHKNLERINENIKQEIKDLRIQYKQEIEKKINATLGNPSCYGPERTRELLKLREGLIRAKGLAGEDTQEDQAKLDEMKKQFDNSIANWFPF